MPADVLLLLTQSPSLSLLPSQLLPQRMRLSSAMEAPLPSPSLQQQVLELSAEQEHSLPLQELIATWQLMPADVRLLLTPSPSLSLLPSQLLPQRMRPSSATAALPPLPSLPQQAPGPSAEQ